MFVDIAPQQQVPEIFSTSRSHRRNSNATNANSNARRAMDEELSKKAELILGHAPPPFDYDRQKSFDLCASWPAREFRTHPPVSVNTQSKNVTAPVVHVQKKDKPSVTVEQLVPLIFKVVRLPLLSKFPPISSFSDEGEKLSDDDEEENASEIMANNTIQQMDYSRARESEEEMMSTLSEGETNHPHPGEDADDSSNQMNPNTFSLSDFVSKRRSPTIEQRSLSPITEPNKVINRKEALIRSFSSSVKTSIDLKQPSLPITLPKHLFLEPVVKVEDERTSKRQVETETSQGSTVKKSKTSHVQEKQEAIISIKSEPVTIVSHQPSVTIAPMVAAQPQKEKPTASVKPLLQSTTVENLSSSNANGNVSNPTISPSSRKAHHDRLKNMSIKQLNSLARSKKKEADTHRRSTFPEIRQSMSLYLESVCYFLQCAHDEPVMDQRMALLTTILPMLQHLVQNHQKMFHIPNNQSVDLLFNLRQKFLLINYWLQSFIYQLQFQTNWPAIERCAPQVTEYFHHLQSPSSTTTSDPSNQLFCEFSKHMLTSYQSTSYWNKAERLMRDASLKEFLEQLFSQNQNRRLTRDDRTFDFILYIFDAIDLLRHTVV